jgi:serine/threonine-protein phosphatase 2A activator
MASHPASQAPAGHAAPSIPNLKDRIPKLEPRRRRQGPENPTPVPETPTLPPPPPVDEPTWTYRTPVRRIVTAKDHEIFLASPTCELIKAWVFGLADAVVDVPCSAVQRDEDLSGVVKNILAVLEEAETFVAQSPPDEQGGSRFGNKAFRGFLDLASARSQQWHRSLGLADDAAIAEASTYLNQSFGNRSRIDYGSGHELNFIMWLLCLRQLRVVDQNSDARAIVLRVFPRYLRLMRTIQMTYYLEPAGSHGVWGLDDYQFLPFLFGAAQLLHHPYITPRAIHQDLTLEEFGKDFLYLDQVSFVNSTKTVKGLRWHSPMLDDISSAKSWTKVNGGMRRMFVAEVLGKLPVMQHFLFGSLIPPVDGMSEETGHADGEDDGEEVDGHEGHDHTGKAHDGTGWGDCCGIKVPSSIAAAQEMRKRGQEQSLRRIPFD